ncbi:hypothetical protein BT96DRAFT_206485 [Gymnopus androsaceus JB14]|uniref:Uncharacterized protein n=1 Tax=Gymnopus androsaceus JB14 TaxID=1447944 RepID=A0A6A4I808_9AGAR|nr:hypothetical protein BT96DRAFT_206485 [Gymnopus androsaceus JB14]
MDSFDQLLHDKPVQLEDQEDHDAPYIQAIQRRLALELIHRGPKRGLHPPWPTDEITQILSRQYCLAFIYAMRCGVASLVPSHRSYRYHCRALKDMYLRPSSNTLASLLGIRKQFIACFNKVQRLLYKLQSILSVWRSQVLMIQSYASFWAP